MSNTLSSSFVRPATTPTYASGQLVANSATAALVTPLSWAIRGSNVPLIVRRVKLKKSNTTVTAATFRLHLYTSTPTIANGDTGTWSTNDSGYLGSIDLDMTGTNGRTFTDACTVHGTPAVGTEMYLITPGATTIYGLIEARAAYVGGTSETITCDLEIVSL